MRAGRAAPIALRSRALACALLAVVLAAQAGLPYLHETREVAPHDCGPAAAFCASEDHAPAHDPGHCALCRWISVAGGHWAAPVRATAERPPVPAGLRPPATFAVALGVLSERPGAARAPPASS